jgi:hypothetical protein
MHADLASSGNSWRDDETRPAAGASGPVIVETRQVKSGQNVERLDDGGEERLQRKRHPDDGADDNIPQRALGLDGDSWVAASIVVSARDNGGRGWERGWRSLPPANLLQRFHRTLTDSLESLK